MIPSWLEAASRWANISVVFLGFLAAAAGAAALYFSNRLGSLKDDELKRFQAESAATIASANARSQEAIEGTAKANERAAQAELHAATAREEAERERLARVELEVRIAPRRLSPEQRRAVAHALQPFRGMEIGVLWAGTDQEATILKTQVVEALRDARLKLTHLSGLVTPEIAVTGIVVSGPPGSSDFTLALTKALRQSGLAAEARQRDGPVEMFVGVKPLD